MKAICSVVTSSAAMIRSASFSRPGSSRTTMNWPSPRRGRGGVLACLLACCDGGDGGSYERPGWRLVSSQTLTGRGWLWAS